MVSKHDDLQDKNDAQQPRAVPESLSDDVFEQRSGRSGIPEGFAWRWP